MIPRWLKTALVLGAIGVAVTAAYHRLSRPDKAPQYVTASVDRGPIRASISATGTCSALVTVQVGSQVSGNIKELYADFNTQVKKGQLVALIDPALHEARLAQARANLESQQAAVVNAEASLRGVEADVASAQAALEGQRANALKARVAMEDARRKLEHTEELYRRGIVSLEERDTARTNFESAQASVAAADAQVRAAEYSVKAAEAQREVARTRLDQARAQLRVTEAAVEQAEVDLRHTRIVAPVDGTVIARKMDVGQTVAASFQAPTIFEIAQDLTQMQVIAKVDEADVGQVREGQTATFSVDAYPGDVFEGRVQQIRKSPNTLQNVVTYDAVIEVANEDLKLFPGMTAQVRIEVDRREDALRVPNAALRVRMPDAVAQAAATPSPAATPEPGDGPQSTLWRLGEDGVPHPVRVVLGITDGQVTEIRRVLEGSLDAGDRVVVAVVASGAAAAGTPAASAAGGGPRRGGRGF